MALKPGLAAADHQLAAADHQEKNLQKAKAGYEAVVALARKHDLIGAECTALVGIGATHMHSQRKEEAEEVWEQARRRAARAWPRRQELTEVNIQLCRTGVTVTPR